VQVLEPPWPTGFGEQVTVPAPAGLTAVAIAYMSRVKFAVTLCAETPVSVQVAPAQSPLQLAKVYPVLAVAVHVLAPPCATGLGEQVTVPAPAGLTAVAMAYVFSVKFAVTLCAETTPVSTQ